ncbi:DUF4352 domain-containing protein [Sanguibacter sp. HDW7]|nr:DUF4352 domain-containing protein [Sanguibacter sp. HDW7]
MPQPAPPRLSWFARHKVLTVVGALVVLGVVGNALGGGGDDTPAAAPTATSTTTAGGDATKDEKPKDDATKDDASKEEKPAKDEKKDPGVGDTVRDGKFEFVVTKVSDGGTSIGPKGFAEKAQGRFVLVHVDVTNIGKEPQYFFGDNQTVYDSEDREFSADTTAAIYLEDSSSFIEEINPGNTVEGTLVFDLPKGVGAERIELHDSVFSGGVVVDLR